MLPGLLARLPGILRRENPGEIQRKYVANKRVEDGVQGQGEGGVAGISPR